MPMAVVAFQRLVRGGDRRHHQIVRRPPLLAKRQRLPCVDRKHPLRRQADGQCMVELRGGHDKPARRMTGRDGRECFRIHVIAMAVRAEHRIDAANLRDADRHWHQPLVGKLLAAVFFRKRV